MRARRCWLSALMCVLALAVSTPSSAQLFHVVSGKADVGEHTVEAGATGARIRLAKNVMMTLSPGTRMYKVHKRAKLWLSNKGTTLTHVVAIVSGRADVECNDPERAVMVRGPLGVASAARSGRMNVIAAPDQVSLVNVQGDVIWAAGASKFQRLEPNQIQTLSKHQETLTTRLPAPSVRMQNSLFGGFGRSVALSGVDWEPVLGAAGYVATVEQLAPEQRSLVRLQTSDSALTPAPRLPEGRYALSVQAIDRFGMEGHASEPQPFSVVGVKTTDGGYIDERGNIVAGYDRRLHLTYADGLVMKGGAIDWGPVPPEIVLPSAEPMNLHVRQAGDTRMLSTRILAHKLQTTVTVGPKYLRWPGESAQIEVSIVGPDGRPAPAWVEPRFRVLLGIDELDVSFTKVGDKFVAEVPSREGEGPWVVRVAVEDQYGHALGRDFVEIAPQEKKKLPPPPAPLETARASR